MPTTPTPPPNPHEMSQKLRPEPSDAHLNTPPAPSQNTQGRTRLNQSATRTQPTSSNRSKRGPGGRAPGSQGYTAVDCTALVLAVKQILPLGSQEWNKVLDLYNNYARANNRALRECDPLRAKFKSLHESKKPTGDAFCPPYIREAKAVDREIRARAFENTIANGDHDVESDDER